MQKRVQWKVSFPVLCAERVQVLISSYSSFASVGCKRYVMVLGIKKRGSLNVRHVQIIKQTQQRTVQA